MILGAIGEGAYDGEGGSDGLPKGTKDQGSKFPPAVEEKFVAILPGEV